MVPFQEAIAAIDFAKVLAGSIHHDALIPWKPTDPFAARRKDMLVAPKGDPLS
jgi:hypothetical protein